LAERSTSVFYRLWQSLSGDSYNQAPVSKHFPASTIEPGFGDYIWDGSPGAALSGWPFLQSLLHKDIDFLAVMLHYSSEFSTTFKKFLFNCHLIGGLF
jgi:hypothetical protein